MKSFMKHARRSGLTFQILWLLVLSHDAGAQECIYTGTNADQSNNIGNYLVRHAAEITTNSLCDIQSIKDWEAARGEKYTHFMESLGIGKEMLNSERSPLNTKVTGVVQMDGYRIEKLYYESQPSLYVPGNLYIPDDIDEPRPAILYLCGHADGQKVAYQAYVRKLVQLGFVCLILETTHQGEVEGEHHGCYARGWFHWYSKGYTPAGVEVWNAMRGLDLLAGMKEVDAERLGVTGRSGGGAQSWFVAAADERVKAAIPEVGATTLHEQILTRTIDGHCDCMMPINTYKIDFTDIGALIAPRSLLIQQGDRDRLTNIEGVRNLYSGIKRIYNYYKVPEKIEFLEYPGGHGSTPYSRYNMLSFFVRELMGKEPTPELIGDTEFYPSENLSAEELEVYVDGAPADDRTKTIYKSFIDLPAPPSINKVKELDEHSRQVKEYLQVHTFGAFPERACYMDPRLIFRSSDMDEYGSEIYSITPEEGWRLRVDFRRKLDPANKEPLLIVLQKAGDWYSTPEDFADELGDQGNVAYINLRGIDAAGWGSGYQWHVRRAAAWTGRTIASMQVYDLLRAIEFCRSLPGVDPDQVRIAAREELGAVTLYAALLDGSIDRVILRNPPATQDTGSSPDGSGPAIEMLNCLRVTDVCQIPALIPETEVWMKGDVPDTYQWSENVRARLGFDRFVQLDK